MVLMEPHFDWTESVAERKIQEAMEAGEFDNLPGKGKPLDLDVNPFEPAHLRAVNRLLKNSRALPDWLQMQKDIEHEIALLATAKERTLRSLRHAANASSRHRIAERFRGEYREKLDVINTLILKYNFIVPEGARRPFVPRNIAREMAALNDDLGIRDTR